MTAVPLDPTGLVKDSHLEKARGALAAAREVLDHARSDHKGLIELRDAEDFNRKLSVATVQAHVASAEALTRIAEFLEGRFG